ncbi:MAG: DUF423 domain-containing protein [Alphaproteobacteria bacterium]|nr:DUF423 domain-containing protein [Alphaproteobacteria bacterium]
MKKYLFLAGVNGAIAVLAGAFAAHALGSRLDPRMLTAFSTGATYHLVHSLALGIAALAARGAARRRALIAAVLFVAGIILFCFSLYLLALTGWVVFAFATPVGGIAFVAGWIMLALAGLKLE